MDGILLIDEHVYAAAYRHMYFIEGMAVLGVVGYTFTVGICASEYVYRGE